MEAVSGAFAVSEPRSNEGDMMSDTFIPISRPHLSQREEDLVLEALRSGWVSSIGQFIDAFEARFAAFCGVDYAVAVSNGTTGLHLALEALRIGPGDEVIVPDLTFVASANAVAYTGAVPVLADIDPATLCLSAETVAPLIGPRTRAIMPVHLYGHPADMDPLMELARRHGLHVVEDAAEAHGAEYKGRRVGGIGDVGVFSFYGNKIITTGEGGMLTTNDRDLYLRARTLRDHAMSAERRYWHPERGFNYRMTNLQAALGVAQMESIDAFIAHRGEVMSWYTRHIEPAPGVRLNHVANWAKNVFWMICLEVDWFDEALRARFMERLKAANIDTRPYFHTMSSMPMYARTPLPVAARKALTGVNLPTFQTLEESDVRRIAAVVNQALAEFAPA